MKTDYDLTILGGGLAGLSLAVQCRQAMPDARILVLEKRSHPVPEAAHKVGESTVEVAAHYFGEMLGLQQHIKEQQLPKLGLRFFFPHGENQRIEDRLELGGRRYAPCPSYQLDRGRFENHLGDLCLDRGIDFFDESTVDGIELQSSGHRIAYQRRGEPSTASSRWVVDASGRRAILKRQLGLQMDSPHIGNAAWFRFNNRIRIDDWSNNDGWHANHDGDTARWYSTNHLMGKGYWVWMIPLSSGSTSMGIVAAEPHHQLSDFNSMEKALEWLDRYEPQCGHVAREHLDQLQDFRAIKHYAVECKQVFSRKRWGITGEAGFFHDPFYSPGSDFIAFSNTFLTDLIQRDMQGRGFRIRAFAYDRIFKRFYYGTKTAYLDQYAMFGNPTVMPVKILWDYLVYWSITAYIFMHGRMCEQLMYVRNLRNLGRLGELNERMQSFFRQWHEATDPESHPELADRSGVIDISSIPLIREANTRLKDAMTRGEFMTQFSHNIAQLEQLAHEIAAEADLGASFRLPRDTRSIRAGAFASVFQPQGGGESRNCDPAAAY